MKKLTWLFYAFVCITFFSCRHHDVDITYNDADHHYSMDAYFNKDKTREIEYYLDRKLGRASNISFVNTNSDAMLTLHDHTKFYIRKAPGHIRIKLNKDENSYAAYHKIKSMCEGMETVLAR